MIIGFLKSAVDIVSSHYVARAVSAICVARSWKYILIILSFLSNRAEFLKPNLNPVLYIVGTSETLDEQWKRHSLRVAVEYDKLLIYSFYFRFYSFVKAVSREFQVVISSGWTRFFSSFFTFLKYFSQHTKYIFRIWILRYSSYKIFSCPN